MNKELFKGILFVGLGAAVYGMLATFVKLAYQDGYTTAEVTSSQFFIGLIGLLFLNILQSVRKKTYPIKPSGSDGWKLLLIGTSLGCTSLFYYLSVVYLNVSIAIILLMQSVWISVVVESIIARKLPTTRKILATLLVLTGTVFATNAFNTEITFDWRGVLWGILAACSFSTTMYASNRIANYLPALTKSFIMLCGGAIVIFCFAFFSQIGPYYFEFMRDTSTLVDSLKKYDYSILWTYGLFLAVFGTILPPIFFNLGFPKTGLGLGSIISSIELPVSVLMAYILLNETILGIQWFGIGLILLAVIWMNISGSKE